MFYFYLYIPLCVLSVYLLLDVDGLKSYSFIKEIDNIIYVGGMNSLKSYEASNNSKDLTKLHEEIYAWPPNIMNGSDIGEDWKPHEWPENFPRGPTTLAFENCLNWKQEHPNSSVRDVAYDFPRWFYHTPSGDFETMNYSCVNSFIKSVERLDNDTLWVCGTFGAFPRAFSVHKSNLKFIKFVDQNVMSCSRYVDEPMATYVDSNKERYIASGWGLYRPDKYTPDVPYNNSTMLYTHWRSYRNLVTYPVSVAFVLSSDVNFINVVKETDYHLYFFGHEINKQYGMNNQDDRSSWQSFMVRICKNDSGYNFTHDLTEPENLYSAYTNNARFGNKDYTLSPGYNHLLYTNTFPTRHFVTPMKVNFGCYISKRTRAISDNHFWGESNVVYLNRLADVIFDPMKTVKFKTKNNHSNVGCNDMEHAQLPLLGLFNGPGIVGTGVEPTGALCQLHINRNIFVEEGSKQGKYHINKFLNVEDAFDEIMALSSTTTPSFWENSLFRTNGFTLYPYWNQGVILGKSGSYRPSYMDVLKNVGKCHPKEFYDSMTKKDFLKIMNFTTLAWPSEIANRLTSVVTSVCQYYSAELYGFNATFVVPGVEFKRMFIIADNITNYVMHKLTSEEANNTVARKFTSPLMVVGIISTTGVFYRVVLCDFDNGILNDVNNKSSNLWYNWCIFRHTNQPYIYRQFIPMEKRDRNQPVIFRASSLLLEKMVVKPADLSNYPRNRDLQFHAVKGVLEKGDYLHIVTSENVYQWPKTVNCTDYVKCIDCASDPFCMWSKKGVQCIKYESATYKDTLHIQDVLDRGFKCASIIGNSTDTLDGRVTNVLQCSNATFWRGNIVWKEDGREIKRDNKDRVIGDTYIFYPRSTRSTVTISCHGIKSDHDKLFNSREYEWINRGKSLNDVLLNRFVMNVSSWNIVCLLLAALAALGVLAGACVVILPIGICVERKRRPRKRCTMSPRKVNEPQTAETLLSQEKPHF